VKALFSKRMIEVRVRFWTDGITLPKGFIIQKHAWASGTVRMQANESHQITTRRALAFGSLMELPGVIERVLIGHGIVLMPGGRMGAVFQALKIGQVPVPRRGGLASKRERG
jgi:hypothetical protein